MGLRGVPSTRTFGKFWDFVPTGLTDNDKDKDKTKNNVKDKGLGCTLSE